MSAVLSIPLSEVPLASLDFETTGLRADAGHRVVEVGVARWQPGGERIEYATLIDPQQPIALRTIDIHGITDEMVRGAPRFAEAFPQLVPLLSDAVIIGHNIRFDLVFLREECAKAGLDAPGGLAVVDTLALARHVFRLPRCGLAAIAQRVGLPLPHAHRALADARATLTIFQQMVELLTGQGSEPLTIQALLDLIEDRRQQRGISTVRAQLEDAMRQAHPVEIDYTGYTTQGALWVPRPITVLAVRARKIEAFCHLRGARRTFRLERIRAVRPLPAQEQESA